MPATERSNTRRLVLTVAVLLAAVGFIAAVLITGTRGPANTPAPAAAAQSNPTAPTGSTGPTGPSGPASPTPSPEAGSSSAATGPTGLTGPTGPVAAAAPATSKPSLRARRYDPAPNPPAPIGSADKTGKFSARLDFTLAGAGIDAITFSQFFADITDKIAARGNPNAAANQQSVETRERLDGRFAFLAARAIDINGTLVELLGFGDPTDPAAFRPVWRETAPGAFEAVITDDSDTPVARLTRRYELPEGSFAFTLRQTLENLSPDPLKVQLVQYGPLDQRKDSGGYNLDMRRVRFGYLLDPRQDPSRQIVRADEQLMTRPTLFQIVLNAATGGGAATPNPTFNASQVWPNLAKFSNSADLVWLAQTSRYFTVAVFPVIDPSQTNPRLAFDLAQRVDGIIWGDPKRDNGNQARLITQLTSAVFTAEPGKTLDLSVGAYAGPLSKRHLSPAANPAFGPLNMGDMPVFNLGGPCWFCTFQWLGNLLYTFLSVVHDYVVFDWAVAIMILVLVVRTLLHPLTKRSQVSMTKFGKQMQRLAPKQKKLQEKYKDDPKALRAETAKLMREEGVSPTGALGCLPLFLQTPIWIALYAMLYFVFELRHEPAFYGLFQAVSGGRWTFLADLSMPDHFIEFGRAFQIPLISGLMGPVSGINILPLLLGVVFFIQTKYMSPPTSANMTPEMEMQQKMMKVMMVVMFPIFMYNAPSGLAVYFITNSTLGILESKYIRAHIDTLDLDNPDKIEADRRRRVERSERLADMIKNRGRKA
ncbi:MAG: membrane protein insertase YidC [Phycisphaerales bacterium]|nr:membrane protein insertase YidC [Phycisphaerales bacterium]